MGMDIMTAIMTVLESSRLSLTPSIAENVTEDFYPCRNCGAGHWMRDCVDLLKWSRLLHQRAL